MKRLPHGTSGLELLASIVVLAVLIALVVLIGWPIQCRVRWEGSGLESRYQFMAGGCFVKTAAGRWIPSDRVREVNPNDATVAVPVAPIPTR